MTLLEQWLYKAEEDLGSAIYLLKGNFYGTAIYHTQQAAEKAFKSYCVYICIPIPRTHNLDMLCQLCQSVDADFENIYLYAIDLRGHSKNNPPIRLLEIVPNHRKILNLPMIMPKILGILFFE